MMWFTYILFTTGLLLLFTSEVEPRKSHHHEKTMSQKIENNFQEGQRFMKEQINSRHSNRGWKHGKKKSKSHHSRHSSSSSDESNGRHISGYEKQFKDFVTSHKCEGSPVYIKFLQYYKTATANLQKKSKDGSRSYETSWLQELANNPNSCSISCPNGSSNGADTSSKKVDKKKKSKKEKKEEKESTNSENASESKKVDKKKTKKKKSKKEPKPSEANEEGAAPQQSTTESQ